MVDQSKSPYKPQLLNLIICDSIIREQGTNKLTLIGLFNKIYSKSFPCMHPNLHIYVALTDAEGQMSGEIRFVDITTEEVIAQLKGPLNFPNRLAIVELNFCIKNIPIPKVGQYRIEFWANDKHIGDRKFYVEGKEG